jgi:hypothetical protein
MPFKVHIPQPGLFVEGFLHVVLPESPLPQAVECADSFRRMLLADRQNADLPRASRRLGAGRRYTCTDFMKLLF